MSLSLFNVKKWWLMLSGKSVLHVNQKIGENFSCNQLRGYYNDMTQKVTMQPELLGSSNLPIVKDEKGNDVVFPVAIFQYGLGAYDLYLKEKDTKYLDKFSQCVEWALSNQEESGAWNNFFYVFPNTPYGAMAQGEGASLLCRAYAQFNDEKYIIAAKKAIYFMLKSNSEGGPTLYDKNDVILLEYTHLPAVLNGWVFAWWGVYDYCLIDKDKDIERKMNMSLHSLVRYLPQFSNKLWSKYDLAGNIASPFYHHLHIAQLQAMYKLTGIEMFNKYAVLWEERENNKLFYAISFVQKAIQKIIR